jgi:excisionase family DNA binding protein
MGPPAASYVPTVRSPIGEHSIVLLLARLLVQASATPGTTQTEKPEALDRLLSVVEVSRILNLRPPHVYELVRRHTLPAVRVGKYVRVRAADLQVWIEAQREEGVDENIRPGLGFSPPMIRPSTKRRDKRSR